MYLTKAPSLISLFQSLDTTVHGPDFIQRSLRMVNGSSAQDVRSRMESWSTRDPSRQFVQAGHALIYREKREMGDLVLAILPQRDESWAAYISLEGGQITVTEERMWERLPQMPEWLRSSLPA